MRIRLQTVEQNRSNLLTSYSIISLLENTVYYVILRIVIRTNTERSWFYYGMAESDY